MKVFSQISLNRSSYSHTQETISCYRPLTNKSMYFRLSARKLAQSQLRNHINASPISAPLQLAYGAFHSTETAMTKVVSDLLTKCRLWLSVIIVIAWYQRCLWYFESHTITATSSRPVWLHGQSILWLKPYLSDRRSLVSVGASKSNTITHSTSVSQGSVLGPLLVSISPPHLV